MKIMKFIMLLFIIAFYGQVYGQVTIPLYSGTIPGSISTPDNESSNASGEILFKVSRPTITIYLPPKEKSNGTAVIICPGGGYGELDINHDGFSAAGKFNELGVAVFVLKYRLPDDLIMTDKSIGPLQDAQQAIKIVRERADEWNIDKNRIGIMGFSSGGNMASAAGTHFNNTFIENPLKTSLRPDFMLLIYPVISLTDKIGHKGTRENLLGEKASSDKINYFSNELQITRETPPSFLIHALDDKVVPVENSISFFEGLQLNSIPAGLHIFPEGGHGFFNGFTHDKWFGYCIDWMRQMNLLSSGNDDHF
jgi:acetyl esterase/lipase